MIGHLHGLQLVEHDDKHIDYIRLWVAADFMKYSSAGSNNIWQSIHQNLEIVACLPSWPTPRQVIYIATE